MRQFLPIAKTLFFGTMLAIGFTSTASADWSNDIGAPEQFLAEESTGKLTEPMDSNDDVDFVFLEIPVNRQTYVRFFPGKSLDIAMDIWRPGDTTTPAFTRDIGVAGDVEWELLPNSTGQEGIGYLCSFKVSDDATAPIGGPVNYTLEFVTAPIDLDQPWVLFNNAEVYSVGEEFALSAAYINTKETAGTFDLYLTMDVLGTFYWFPGWGEAFANVPGQNFDAGSGGILTDPLTLVVPPALAGFGPITFYNAMSDTANGKFSNVCYHPVSFIP